MSLATSSLTNSRADAGPEPGGKGRIDRGAPQAVAPGQGVVKLLGRFQTDVAVERDLKGLGQAAQIGD